MNHILPSPQMLFKLDTPEGKERNLRIKADQWIEDNPGMYELFIKYAKKLMEGGHMFSAKLIAERVRWEVRVEWRGEFKISNDLVAYIARRLADDIPELKAVFKFKSTKF